MSHIYDYRNIEFVENKPLLPHFGWFSTSDIYKESNASKLNYKILSLPQGRYSYPYHWHKNAEEFHVVLEGAAILRSYDGFTKISKGQVIFFEKGELGAHQLYNPYEEPCIYLDIRTLAEVDICYYPDSGKMNVLPDNKISLEGEQVSYFYAEDEENLAVHWQDYERLFKE